MNGDTYARLYHKFSREFPDVYADDRLLAGWVRLLMLADASWPMRPPLPRSVRPRVLSALIDSGLVIPDADNYTVLGLDAERTRRSNAGRTGAAVRWQSERNAIADADAMPSKAEQNKEKIPPPPAERGRRKAGTNPRARGTAPRDTGTAPRQNGASPRQERNAEKRAGIPTSVHEILRRAAAGGES